MTDKRIKEELKPCPFCGNETIRIWSGMDNEDKRSTYRVSCSSCGASGPYFKINTSDWGLEEIKTAWNTRAAERLAKTEALEEVRRCIRPARDMATITDYGYGYRQGTRSLDSYIETMIAELKELQGC